MCYIQHSHPNPVSVMILFKVASQDGGAGVKCLACLLLACWKHGICCITVGSAGESHLAPELHSVLAYIVERGQVM